MEESNNAEIDEADGFSLLDVSVADDFLLVPSSDAEVSREDNAGDNHIEAAQLSQPSESFESKRPNRKGSFNMRKSLAWDSAFFTCAGVLNAEELSTIIEGSEMGRRQKQLLPGIQEDLNVSTDSISTFETESNSLTLESLEADLFCDVRALKQRSSKGPNLGSTISNRGHGETECNIGSGSKTSKSPSRNMVKAESASKRLNASRQGLGKSTKLGSVPAQITSTPDFTEVYRFIGSVFDPDTTGHVQKLKEMDPINIETVLLLMRNLTVNLSSPDSEPIRNVLSSYDANSQTVAVAAGSVAKD